ncbi:hypothetical protein ACIQD3_13310 [Peribacillus loiseleuriae]|uniref:hypothetical protein n=1 Tax=Peribacillus loiseleuriae TaxID=1679170 RepID=UPI0037F48109
MIPMISVAGKSLMDGGIANPIPILKSEGDGNRKNVIILTRNKEYRKNKQTFGGYFKRKYEGLINALTKRHEGIMIRFTI